MRGTLSNQITDYDKAGSDAHSGRKFYLLNVLRSSNRADDGEARANGPLGLIFMGRRPSEICQNAVTHELSQISVKAGNLARYRVLV